MQGPHRPQEVWHWQWPAALVPSPWLVSGKSKTLKRKRIAFLLRTWAQPEANGLDCSHAPNSSGDRMSGQARRNDAVVATIIASGSGFQWCDTIGYRNRTRGCLCFCQIGRGLCRCATDSAARLWVGTELSWACMGTTRLSTGRFGWTVTLFARLELTKHLWLCGCFGTDFGRMSFTIFATGSVQALRKATFLLVEMRPGLLSDRDPDLDPDCEVNLIGPTPQVRLSCCLDFSLSVSCPICNV